MKLVFAINNKQKIRKYKTANFLKSKLYTYLIASKCMEDAT